ncbi:unnamed protein product [Caenorhabditis bovis]|uniref:Transmembrane protein n=1 Tax=Caenorhabditis bovis TaxID=2654633 RepID=A0A8S1E7M2_9PELO|nr:unnamed protein product [Caenorhabditis bovis]
MCLCGLLSITHSVNLILCIEIFFALVLLIQSPDLLSMDGTYFYFLGNFDGGGVFFFSLHVTLCVSCLITSILLYVGSTKKIPPLILPHLFWQIVFVITSIVSIIVLLALGFKGKMLLPSSIVLSCMIASAGVCEIWWCFLSLAYYRYMKEMKLDSPWSHDELCTRDDIV